MRSSLVEKAWVLCVIAVVLLLSAPANACSCYESHFATMPAPGGELPVDGRIVLDGYGSWSKQLGDLGRQGLMLVSGRERVPLRVEKVFGGAERRSAVVLVPARHLRSGRRYSLVVEPPGKKQRIPLLFEGKPVVWGAVVAASKAVAPRVVEPVLERVLVSDGKCGSSVSMRVQLPEGIGEVVLVSMVETQGASVYPLRVVDGLVEMTWGPCGGVFRFQPGQRYVLEVSGASKDLSPVETAKGRLEVQVPPVDVTPRPSP
jgi:hypothetical protein